ncbi:MAG: MaoC family dehydratase N-terminal domain-containing protein [Elusimicrobia bacterium]|nr:MaoC family dehydratase N-terminal domain-containing protein [Elusimicrobiota bacterium]
MSLYFDEFAVGQIYKSPNPRLVSEATINSFAEISGDKNRLHVDEGFAKKTPFGGRIAHGLLGLSIASGLLHDMGIVQESVLAFVGLSWRFKGPARIGDSLNTTMTVTKTRALGKKGGLVVFDAALTNQKGEVLQEGEWSLMVRNKP